MQAIPTGLLADLLDSLAAWATRYLALAVVGVRSEEVTQKIALHLERFVAFFLEGDGHDRISTRRRRATRGIRRAPRYHSASRDGDRPARG